MLKIQTYTAELAGTSYEIGYQFGKMIAAIPHFQIAHTAGLEGFGPEQAEEAAKLFDRWCPGLTEELCGFADALKVKPEQIFFYGMTYLLPRCSHIALLPSTTAEGKPLLARNYKFSHEAEDFCLIKTSVTGRYSHMGTSVLHFGRDDGFNEHGLAVTMSSCGFPVGALPYMTEPFMPKVIPGGRYAVFTHQGTLQMLPQTFDYIWGTWFLTTKEEMDWREDFELYDECFLGYDHPDSEVDLYIPVRHP